MALTPDDAQRERYEQQRRLGALRTRAAQLGAEAPPQLLNEIEDLERLLTTGGMPNLDYETMQQPQAQPVSRYEFNQVVLQVNRITLVLMLSTAALVLASAAFIMAIMALGSR